MEVSNVARGSVVQPHQGHLDFAPPTFRSAIRGFPCTEPELELLSSTGIKHVPGLLRVVPIIWPCYPAKCHQLRPLLQLTARRQLAAKSEKPTHIFSARLPMIVELVFRTCH
jgi:hypothetical protein